jgi:hypothetical protein
MRCTVCSHPDLHAIDQALLAGDVTLRDLARHYGLSRSALSRHHQHLQAKIYQAQKRLEQNLRLGYVFKLNQILAEVEIAAAKALADDNIDQVFKGARVRNRLIRDLGKLDTPWDPLTVYRVHASPDWQNQGCLLPIEPAFLASGHQNLAGALFQPCPEPDPDLDADDDDAVPDERLSDVLAALSPETLAALHPDLLTSLLLTAAPSTAGTPVRPKRDKSGTKAGQKRDKSALVRKILS